MENANSQDHDAFPNLFRETANMTVDCISVFILADLRTLARGGHLKGNDNNDVLKMPIQADIIPRIWQNNREILKREIRSDEYDTLQYLVDRWIIEHMDDTELSGAECHVIGDEKASNECVYAIYTNAARKQMTVAFRGSVTLKDWFQDAKSAFCEVKNPLYGVSGFEDSQQPELLPLHLGFSDYLYGDAPLAISLPELPQQLQQKMKELPKPPTLPKPSVPSSLKKEKGSGEDAPSVTRSNKDEARKTKIETILDEISSLYETRPDYKLYLTVSTCARLYYLFYGRRDF